MVSFTKKIILLFQLFGSAFGDYKWQIAILTTIGFASGLLEGIGANALIPLFSFIITGSGGGGDDFISRLIEKSFAFLNLEFNLSLLLIFIATLFILKALILFVGSYIQLLISYGYEKKARTELFTRSLQSKWAYLLEQKIGYLEKVLSVEIRYITRLLETISSLILLLTSLIVFFAVALNISVSITLITLGAGVVITVVFQPLVNAMRRITQTVATETREAAHFINENFLGMKTIKAMSVANPIAEAGEHRFETLRKLQIKRSLIGNVFGLFFQPFGVVFILVLFLFSYKKGDFSLPAFVAIVYLIQRIFSQIQSLQSHIQTTFRMIPYLEHVLFYKERMLRSQELGRGDLPFTFKKNFSFEHIFFGHQNEKKILNDVSFSIPKGSFVGLVGPSGAGKTTVVDLMLRLFDPTLGDILLDGASVTRVRIHEYRRNIGYVSQDIHIMNDTVENNIRFFDSSISKERITEAAKEANIHDFIQSLPQGFKTIVGERGVRLSAGQRQRVVIARVLARNPQFLILDEATSALDNESEKKIQEVIESLKGKITVFVIAHRLETVMNCDMLFVLDGGRIIEQGKPHELLCNKNSYFYKIYNIRK